MKDEDGFVSKENILKISVGTISALGIAGSFSNAFAGHTNSTTHSNAGVIEEEAVPGTSCAKWKLNHASHSSHVNHSSY